jgi:hypothetical protein
MYLEMSDKVNLYVKQVGKGRPCIFIHGGFIEAADNLWGKFIINR